MNLIEIDKSFQEMIKHVELGGVAKRSDWGYAENCEISLLEDRLVKNVFISNTLKCHEDDLIGYGFTYNDIISTKWLLL